MKLKFVIMSICIAISLTMFGCTETSNVNNNSLITETGIIPNDKTDYKDYFDFSISMNLKEVHDGNNLGKPLSFKYAINNEITSIALETFTSPDNSMNTQAIPIKVWMICDNEFLPFSLDQGEYKETNEYYENENNVHIISFIGNSEMRFITVIVSAFTNDIPNLQLGLYSGICSYTFVNTNSNNLDTYPEISGDYYYTNPIGQSKGCFNIDYTSINQSVENHVQFSDDFVLSNNDNVYVKYNYDAVDKNQNPIGVYYSLIVLCDGKIIPVFDDNKAYIVSTPYFDNEISSDKTFEYEIPSKYYSSKGLHVLQAVVVPYYIPNALDNISDTTSYGFDGFSTNKTRVVIE